MSTLMVDTPRGRGSRERAMTPKERSGAIRPRVLHLITKFDIGGTERQAVELLKRLDPERFDVRLAAIRNEGPFYSEIADRFPQVPEFPLTSFYNVNAFRQLARLWSLMKQERIHIIHAHDFYAGIIGAAAGRLAGARVIACQRHIKLSDRRVHEWGTRLTHRLAHRVLVNSEAIRDSILAKGTVSAGKVIVIKNGLNVEPAGPSPRHDLRRELGLDAGAKIVGMVARLQPVKGHRFFLEAAARVAARIPSAQFVLVGDGPLRQEIREQAERLGIASRLHLLGDRPDAARVVAAFDLAVLSSLHEGLPNAVMEAMAAGVATVATAVGGTPELIRDGQTGLLVPPGDAHALAGHIEFLLTNEEKRAAIAARAKESVVAEFGMERMVESVERLYRELLAERTGAGVPALSK